VSDASPGSCTQCREQQYLHNGQCLSGCPAGHTEHGNGNFNRRCISPPGTGGAGTGTDTPARTCVARRNNCHECTDDATACTKCRNAKYLDNAAGACVDACAEGFVPVGIGNYNRRCEPVSGSAIGCTRLVAGCHECTDDRSACSFCRDRLYLHEGTCRESCPPGTIANGRRGRFHRECVAAE